MIPPNCPSALAKSEAVASALDGLDDDRGHLVRVGIRCRAAIFQATFPAVVDGAHRNPDRRSTIGDPVAEFADVLRFMETGQTLVVVRAVNGNVVFHDRGETLHRSSRRFPYRRTHASHRWRSWHAFRNRSSLLSLVCNAS